MLADAQRYLDGTSRQSDGDEDLAYFSISCQSAPISQTDMPPSRRVLGIIKVRKICMEQEKGWDIHKSITICVKFVRSSVSCRSHKSIFIGTFHHRRKGKGMSVTQLSLSCLKENSHGSTVSQSVRKSRLGASSAY